ncbi:MAG TPA: DMT family transporter [Myxococcaceae bacterium]|nr:DMT family transporter [Myxococcaceae bacterium]
MLPAASPYDPRERLRADLVLVALTALWGVTFSVVKGSLAFADPWSFLAVRFALGAAVLLPWVGRRVLHRDTLKYGLGLGLLLFLGYALQTTGLRHTTPSRSAFITGLCVLLVPLLSTALFRKAPGVWASAGTVLAVVGLYRLTADELGGEGGTVEGDLLSLGCAVAYAVHILLTGRYARKAPALPLVTVQLSTVACCAALYLPWAERRFEPRAELWIGLGVCGVLASAVAIGLQTWAQGRTSPVRAALIFSLESVFAALYSVAVGMEKLGAREVVGGGLILLGVGVSEVGSYLRTGRRPEPPNSPDASVPAAL